MLLISLSFTHPLTDKRSENSRSGLNLPPRAYRAFVEKDKFSNVKNDLRGFPGGAVVGSLPANAGDTGSSPGLGGSHMPRSN